LIVWGDNILEYFYGGQFVEGAMALAILTVGKFVHVSAGSSGMLLQMTGYHKTLMYISILFAVLSLIGFSLVIHPYGKEGVAFIATTMLIFQNVMQLYYAKKLTGIWTAPAFHNIFKKKAV